MERRRLAIYLLIAAAVVAALVIAAVTRLDIANFVLTVTVLIVATLTLLAAWIPPARLVIERQPELTHAGDLLFFSYPESSVPGGHVPRDVVLQMYVAVANVGGRKALLLGISVEEYLNADGKPVSSELLPVPVLASEYRQWESRDLLARSLHIESETRMPPFVLAPDEVLSLRLRRKWGVNWSPAWDLARLRHVAESLAIAVTHARLLLIYRRGQSLIRESMVVPLVVQAQSDFAQRLATVTSDFNVRPAVAPGEIDPYGSDSGFPIPR
jgi:hypothetical protein